MRDRVAGRHPDLRVEIEIINTKGDKILDAPLAKIGDKGLFTKELETALLDGRIDVAVHSAKDMPTAVPEGLEIIAFTEREDVRDVFVPNPALLEGRAPDAGPLTLDDVPQGARVGTSSLRRRSQLLALRPDLDVVDIRGNVETRLRKLVDEEMSGTILAAAGLSRLGRSEVTGFAFTFDQMLPAVGQGALAIEARADHARRKDLAAALDHRPTALCVAAERALLGTLEGGCQVPIAAHARWKAGGEPDGTGTLVAGRLRRLARRRPFRARRARPPRRRPRGTRHLPRRRAARARRRRHPGRDPHAVSPAGPETAPPRTGRSPDGPSSSRGRASRRRRSWSPSRRSAPRSCWSPPSASSRGRWTTTSRPPCASSRPIDSWCSRARTPCACSPATWPGARRTAACRPVRWSRPSVRPPRRRWRSTASPVIWCRTSSSPRGWPSHWRGTDAAGAGSRVLIPCARDARDVLPETLRARGAVVDVLHIYDTVAAAELAEPAGRVEAADYITFTSASTARRLAGLLEEAAGAGRPLSERLAGARLCSIGPITSQALRELGLDVAVEAREYTAAGLVAAILEDARAR